ncbi:MAG: hypothetical protein JNK05_41465 [Myxococcales bacterium]|nr:hypothetical protein [Myxococcales bacterium]
MNRAWLLCLLSAGVSFGISGCPGGSANIPDTGTVADVPSVTDSAVADTGADARPPPFDAGPAPMCTITAEARHIVDRPGGDRLADPAQLLAVQGGFLVSARYVEERAAGAGDGGVGDASDSGTIAPPVVVADRSIVLPLGADGAPRPAVTLYDGTPMMTSTTAPRLHRTPTGALAILQEVRGNASSPDFLLRLHAAEIANDGTASMARVIRDRVALPDTTVMGAGIFGTSARVESIGDAGLVAASPISILLDSMGRDARPADVLLTNIWPIEVLEQRMRTRADNGAVLVYRRGTQMAFIPFDARGVPEPTGTFDVVGATVPSLEDAAAVGDGVIGVWSRNIAGTTEVHVVVAGNDHRLRLDQELERFSGEGPTVVSVVPAYGGAALVWRRGVDARARVRVAVVAPDGTIRVAPTDLVSAANIEGRIAVVSDGRQLTFVARDGIRADRWGYTFGRACLPAM